MSTIARLVQGSPEWHEHRRRYRNDSETPVVMGVSPWQTPYQLWQIKLGLVTAEVTPPMLHGRNMEPVARMAYERMTNRVMQPLLVVEGEYSASLDGITLAGDRILEIKCPMRGRDSNLWQTACKGELPGHYRSQVQHQLMVTRAQIADVYVFEGGEGRLVQVSPDCSSWQAIRSAWDGFQQHVTLPEPPPLSDRDVRVRDDPQWLEAAAAYLELRAKYDELGTRFDEAKARLVGLTSHPRESGHGVSVTRHWKRGGIDYKKIPELKAIDLERYRGAMREDTRITAS